jgi:acetyltransferase-like isoleucine patch superfamily enzyme
MTIIGTLPPAVHKNAHYFDARECHIDAKGPLEIAATAAFGQGVRIITRSHEINMDAGDDEEIIGDPVPRPVIIEHHAWICSGAILYNCNIGHHSIVAAGAVVRNCIVPPYSVVEGNPAKIIKKWGELYPGWNHAMSGPVDCPKAKRIK